MIEIGNLLDTCGILYTDKQLAKLDKLIKELLKKLSLQQYDSNKTSQNHSNPEDKLRNEDFSIKAELKTFQHYSEPHSNNTITEEIKKEFYHEPYVSLEEFNNSEDVSDMVHESYNLKKKNGGKEITRNSIEIKEEFPNDQFASLETTATSFQSHPKPDLKGHIQNVHEGIKEFKCTICDYETAQRVNLKAHIESVHEGIKRIKKGKCQ